MAPLTFRRLRIWNLAAGSLQLLAGVAILVLSNKDAVKLPIYSQFLDADGWNREDGDPALFYVPQAKLVGEFPIGIWSGVFLLLSAVDHLLVVLPGVNKVYNRMLCANKNPFRWAEYAASAGVMSVLIAQLTGITDIHLLLALFGLMASTMLFGWLMEAANGYRITTFAYTEDPRSPPQELAPGSKYAPAAFPAAFITDSLQSDAGAAARPTIDWTPFLMGCWPFLIVQLITACFFFQGVSQGDPPGFVWCIFFVLLVLYSLFALNQFLQFKQVKGWRGFAAAEWWYIILSLSSKQLLAWITYGGTKRFATS